jgi:hypothetical protein
LQVRCKTTNNNEFHLSVAQYVYCLLELH